MSFKTFRILCDLGKAKGLDVGASYLSDKKAKEFVSNIAFVEFNTTKETFKHRVLNDLCATKHAGKIADSDRKQPISLETLVMVLLTSWEMNMNHSTSAHLLMTRLQRGLLEKVSNLYFIN